MSLSDDLNKFCNEDFIEYFLFPYIDNTVAHDGDVKSSKNDELLNLMDKILKFTKKYCADYIWNKDNFELRLEYPDNSKANEKDNLPPHFYGICYFGDNIEDEWFIVSLLRRLTLEIPNLVVRVVDSDGEFLLIESADYLPRWANPETCSERVFLFNGSIYIINDNINEQNSITIKKNIQKIYENPKKYRCDEPIQNCIIDRIDGYPENIKNNLHRAIVYMPFGVACLLKKKPSLISSAVRAFCNQDMIDKKVCKAMRFFPPENRVYSTVTFTKYLYAKLMHCNYKVDERTGWNLPKTDCPKYNSHYLGVKLACGFEILASQTNKRNKDEINDKSWLSYLQNLNKKGYFQENIEGSIEYKKLLEKAKTYFNENQQTLSNSYIGDEIQTLLKSCDYHVEEFSENFDDCEQDSDSWLNINSEELDEFLKTRYGVKKLFTTNGTIDSNILNKNINEFLDTKSDYDGIEIEKNLKKNTKEQKSSTTSNSEVEKIDFDPEAFQNHCHDLLDLIIPEDNWESNSDMSDYEDDDNIDKDISDMSLSNDDDKSGLLKYMKQMDLELSKTTVKSYLETSKGKDDSFDDIESFTPVSIDKNILKNLMHSYELQLGGPGPASTLLNSVKIDKDEKSIESTATNDEKIVTDI